MHVYTLNIHCVFSPCSKSFNSPMWSTPDGKAKSPSLFGVLGFTQEAKAAGKGKPARVSTTQHLALYDSTAYNSRRYVESTLCVQIFMIS